MYLGYKSAGIAFITHISHYSSITCKAFLLHIIKLSNPYLNNADVLLCLWPTGQGDQFNTIINLQVIICVDLLINLIWIQSTNFFQG